MNWRIHVLPLCVISAMAVGAQAGEPISFELDVMPVLTANGCNAGACHGKQRGQNGFQLSLLGFDPDFDHAALTRNARGRRVFLAAPERSLLLEKPSGGVPHGGGLVLEPGGSDYETIRRWIAAGTPRRIEGEPALERITVEPASLSMVPDQSRTLKVTAHYSDGSTRDVTSTTQYQSQESAIVASERDGQIRSGPLPGETAVMARYMNHIAVAHIAIPLAGDVPQSLYDELPGNNFIDELVWKKLQSLRITPSAPVDDATFIRRVTLDVIGRLPSADEVRRFLSDAGADKRARLVDSLLERPEYADHWAGKWADLLRPNPYRVGIKAVLNYDHWIRDQFRKNVPYDTFVRRLVAAQGSTWHNGAATLFRDRRSPDEITTLVSQLFLGIRLECAKCHHHPFEKWGQDDFYSFAAYFGRVGRKGTGLSPPISGSEEIVFTATRGDVRHPLTGDVMAARPLFGSAPEFDDADDPREALALWMTSPANEYFAQVQVNRVWADLMGRGIVEPVDDLRATNPPTNPELLAALGADFQEHSFDLKELIRTITSSYVYSLSSIPTDRNAADTRNYSRHYRTQLRAEVLLDAIDDITAIPTSFSGMPPGSRASQIWTHRVESLFLDTFGRPDPNQDPPCERLDEPTVTQTLHLMNAPSLHRKVTDDGGTAVRLASSEVSAELIVEELYLMIYGRYPDEKERQIGRDVFTSPDRDRRKATEDLMWALLNTPEFYIAH